MLILHSQGGAVTPLRCKVADSEFMVRRWYFTDLRICWLYTLGAAMILYYLYYLIKFLSS